MPQPHLRIGMAILAALVLCATSGCAGGWLRRGHGDTIPVRPIDNPMFVPAIDREFLWNQTVDAVDDYFRIEREERVRLIGGVMTEGRIDTFPITGSTIFEPWRRDSTPGYEKLHATLQSIRRRATLRVIPTEGGYLIDVVVHKELEDLDRPEHATAGGATLRYDNSLVRQEGAPGRYSVTLGWIPIGRDMTLEQRILADVRARLDVGSDLGHLPPVKDEGIASPSDTHPGPSLAQPDLSPPAEANRFNLSPLDVLPGPAEELPPP